MAAGMFVLMIAIEGSFRRKALWFIAGVVLTTAPVFVTNHARFGAFGYSTSGDYNIATLMIGPARVAGIDGPRPAPGDVWRQPGDRFENNFQESRALRDRAVAWALDHPREVVAANLAGWARSSIGGATTEAERWWGVAWPGRYVTVFRVTVAILALLGVIQLAQRRQWALATLVAGMPLVSFVAHVLPAGAGGYYRFGFPLDLSLVPGAAIALGALLRGTRPAA
jgi:hypothetical protein